MKLTPWEPDLRSLVDRIDAGDIDLQPDFQRQEVWSITKKRRLIDTILRDWSIPPVHLVLRDDKSLEVLDGQQRLAAIRDFLNNVFSIDGTISPKDESITPLHRKRYSKLDPTTRRAIDQYTLRAFRLTDFLPEEPSELFYRLNQPTMLTAGEQRNAFYGEARDQLKSLVSTFQSLGNSRDTIGFSNSRMAYDDVIARILFFVEEKTIAVKARESLISESFRRKTGFNQGTFDATLEAVLSFSAARNKYGAVKLNKATLLSWLVFYLRAGNNQKTIVFLDVFQHLLEKNEGAELVSALVDVFKDRSSLRVTDVSSVVYRDFCMWVLFVMLGGGAVGVAPDAKAIEAVTGAGIHDIFDLETYLDKDLSLEKWGDLE